MPKRNDGFPSIHKTYHHAVSYQDNPDFLKIVLARIFIALFGFMFSCRCNPIADTYLIMVAGRAVKRKCKKRTAGQSSDSSIINRRKWKQFIHSEYLDSAFRWLPFIHQTELLLCANTFFDLSEISCGPVVPQLHAKNTF